ncbi:MAG: AmmeMemoRadiSam system protein A [Usitatibacter sp.]
MPDEARGRILIGIARGAIVAGPEMRGELAWDEDWLREKAASFVTLREAGELRGCIGSVDAYRPLGDDVANNAHAAAYRDPRFSPVTAAGIPRLEVEVSVLTPRVAFAVASEDDALAQLRPGIDGLYLEFQDFRATFLPQVWESLPDPRDFLAELRRKARLPARFWHPELRLSRYGVEKYK